MILINKRHIQVINEDLKSVKLLAAFAGLDINQMREIMRELGIHIYPEPPEDEDPPSGRYKTLDGIAYW